MYQGYEYSSGFGGGSDFGAAWHNPMGMDMEGGGGAGGFLEGGAPKSAEKTASRDRQSVTPLSIKQLLTASRDSDGVAKVDGVDLAVIKVVGLVESVEVHATSIIYKINDGTGSYECKKWLDRDAVGPAAQALIKENDAVRVVGNLRVYDEKSCILVFDISVLQDFDELTHHILEIIFVHLQNTRGPIPGSVSIPSGGFAGGSPARPSNSSFGFQQQSSSSSSSRISGSLPGQRITAGREDSWEKMIADVIRKNMVSEGGVHVEIILRGLAQVGVNKSMSELRNALRVFTEEGAMYSGESEDHYCLNEFA